MDELTIFWTYTALKQRNHTLEYWNKRNGSKTYSKKLNLAIKSRISLLKTNPNMGIKTNFNNTRTISLGHYNILYQKIDFKIIITGFWDNRQNPKKMLKFLIEN